MRVVHIEPKERHAEADARTLEVALAEHVGKDLTSADASVLSGLPLDAAEAGLIALARRFPARMRVSPSGALVFRFTSLRRPRSRRAARVFALLLKRFVEPVLAVLTVLAIPALLGSLTRDVVALGSVAMEGGWFWLVCIPCLAIGAFAALGAVLTLLAFIVMPAAGIGATVGGVSLIYLVFSEPGDAGAVVFMLVLAVIMIALGVSMGIPGIRIWVDLVFRDASWAKRLWMGVLALLMGPRRAGEDPLADERRLAALIRHERGVVALPDLIGLFGWTPAEADSEITRILCDYGGDIVVSDDGAIVYAFTDKHALSGPLSPIGSLLVSAGVAVARPQPEKPRRERFLPGDHRGLVVLLGAIALGALGVVLHPALPLFPGASELAPEMPELATTKTKFHLFGLGLWPYVVLYGALLVRAPFFLRRRGRARRRAALEPYLEIAARTPEGASLPAANLRLVAELGGDYAGTTLSFPELALASAAARRLRADPSLIRALD